MISSSLLVTVRVHYVRVHQIKTSPIANQTWEPPRHHGMLIASNAQYYAYAIVAKSGYAIRILQRENKNRALLKGFVGHVVDLAFAHSGSNKLAVVDQAGNLYYYNLDNANGDVQLIDKYVCVCASVCVRASAWAKFQVMVPGGNSFKLANMTGWHDHVPHMHLF